MFKSWSSDTLEGMISEITIVLSRYVQSGPISSNLGWLRQYQIVGHVDNRMAMSFPFGIRAMSPGNYLALVSCDCQAMAMGSHSCLAWQ
jgi:hypothetical protein